MKKLLLSLFCALVLLTTAAVAQNELVFGNPSGATNNQRNADNFLVTHTGYILSYNKSRGAANWVAWHLEASDIGDIERGNFAPDPMLPAAWQIKPNDYLRSGFDRGHLCPSKDRSTTRADNDETFLMSNMQPQEPNLNQQTWRLLEEHSRTLAGRGNELYIYAGCYGDRGKIRDKITIPTNCFKIIVVLRQGNNDLSRVRRNTRVIAVDMPNEARISRRWQDHLTTVDAIEESTGFDFLAPLNNELENILEARRAGN